jgi:hypothetical protein
LSQVSAEQIDTALGEWKRDPTGSHADLEAQTLTDQLG